MKCLQNLRKNYEKTDEKKYMGEKGKLTSVYKD